MTFYPLATETWDEAELDAIQRVVKSRRFTMGPEVKAFEQRFAETFRSRYAVMVNSGSSANLLAVSAFLYHPTTALRPGDQVIVPAVSWSTTFYPVHQAGLELRFVDISRDSLNIDVDQVETAITPRTKAIFAVNLLGNPCELERLKTIAKKHGLLLLEDNCESMGATLRGREAGTFGTCGTFSTFFSHHISTMEGGVIVTDDEPLYHILLSLRAHGWLREQPSHSHLNAPIDDFSKLFRFVLPGYNVRPLEMEGALGLAQLQKLPGILEARRQNGRLFVETFSNHEGLSIQHENGESSWFGFAIVLRGHLDGRRSEVVRKLAEHGIEARPIVAGNFLANPVMRHLNHSVAAPVRVAEEIDRNGFFLGNHHYPITEQIGAARALIDDVLRSSPAR